MFVEGLRTMSPEELQDLQNLGSESGKGPPPHHTDFRFTDFRGKAIKFTGKALGEGGRFQICTKSTEFGYSKAESGKADFGLRTDFRGVSKMGRNADFGVFALIDLHGQN